MNHPIDEIVLRHAKEALAEVQAINPGPYLRGSTAQVAVMKLRELIEYFGDHEAAKP